MLCRSRCGPRLVLPPSSSGLGHRPFKAATRVRIPLGAPDNVSVMQTNTAAPSAGTTPRGMVWVPGGTFLMGSDLPEYPEEGPPHQVSVDGFWIDETTVTKAQFRRFVKATGYRTVAERPLDPAEYPG